MKFIDKCMARLGYIRRSEVDAALRAARQALFEVRHAQQCGASWYTRGERGLYDQVAMWVRRGLEAIAPLLSEDSHG